MEGFMVFLWGAVLFTLVVRCGWVWRWGPRPYFRAVKGGWSGGVVNFIVGNTGRLGGRKEGGGGGGATTWAAAAL